MLFPVDDWMRFLSFIIRHHLHHFPWLVPFSADVTKFGWCARFGWCVNENLWFDFNTINNDKTWHNYEKAFQSFVFVWWTVGAAWIFFFYSNFKCLLFGIVLIETEQECLMFVFFLSFLINKLNKKHDIKQIKHSQWNRLHNHKTVNCFSTVFFSLLFFSLVIIFRCVRIKPVWFLFRS